MRNNKIQPLSDFEDTLLWMSIRYAMNRQTIASATLPTDIIKNWYSRLSKFQKKRIVTDLNRNYESFGEDAFGSKLIDKPIWLKFKSALDEDNHYEVELIDGTKHIVFEANGKIYPLASYIEQPQFDIYLPIENIINHD